MLAADQRSAQRRRMTMWWRSLVLAKTKTGHLPQVFLGARDAGQQDEERELDQIGSVFPVG